MRTKAVIAGFLMATAIPVTPLAQPYDENCVRSSQDRRAAGAGWGPAAGRCLAASAGP
jgi:hypothetical protein